MTEDLKTVLEKATITEDDLEQILLKENKPEFNILKLCEELAELQEKLLKYLTKKPEKRPSKQDIIDEFGDVAIRGSIVMQQLEITDDEMDERMEAKFEKLINWYKEGKYKGGL